MKTLILIPAYNEERLIGRTLNSLPADRTEPVVVVNGTTDNTVGVAEDFGAQVVKVEQQGKLPALQIAMRDLGERALDPMLILDGDSRPLAPRAWLNGMLNNLRVESSDIPSAVGGPVLYTNGGINGWVRTARRTMLAARPQPDISEVSQCGPNMGLSLGRREVLDSILELPHYWPGEDRAMMATVLEHGGEVRQPINPSLIAVTPISQSFTTLGERLSSGRQATRAKITAHYQQRGAPGSIPFVVSDATAYATSKP